MSKKQQDTGPARLSPDELVEIKRQGREEGAQADKVISDNPKSLVVKGRYKYKDVVVKTYKIRPDRQHIVYYETEREFLRNTPKHENIIKLRGYFDANCTIVVDLLCKDVQDALRDGDIDAEKMINIFKDTAKALQWIHTNKKVYGDLKPENILLDRNNNAILADFDSVVDKDNTVAVFSDAYASPEVANRKPSSSAADVFSLGKMMLRMMMQQELDPIVELGISRRGAHNSEKDPKQGIVAQALSTNNALDVKYKDKFDTKHGCEMTLLARNCADLKASARPTTQKILDELETYKVITEPIDPTLLPNPNRETMAKGEGSSSRGGKLK
ncbi:hypothetical protein Tsubulata_011315 [Turnera subulata]|uniref:Protein kinase domain-containing protein n=1 Tax=Turnera subulata TaxID=218843 RepID=A0A9Q0JD41_9ROSI|nr:hypothetical protein Tsubulata_011315 [Turnera subulata]